jgi:hypothetical protein
MKFKNEEEAKLVFAEITNIQWDGGKLQPRYKTLNEPAIIITNCVLVFTEHTPNTILTFDFYPEDYSRTQDGYKVFNDECECACGQLDNDIDARKSFNRGDVKLATAIRITDEFIDAKLDGRWSQIRIPKNNVVVLTPENSFQQDENALKVFHALTIH